MKNLTTISERLNVNSSQALQVVMAWAHGACTNVFGDAARKMHTNRKRVREEVVGEHTISANNFYITRCREWSLALNVSSRAFLEASIKHFKSLFQTSELWRITHRKGLPQEFWGPGKTLAREVASEKKEAEKHE